MGKIYCIVGKSASGKDSIYKKLLEKTGSYFKTVVPYTTRPVRSGETEGCEYHFVSFPEYRRMESEGRVIESRCYNTVYGEWYYFTADDGQIDLNSYDYLIIMTCEGCISLKNHFGNDLVIPIYIEVEDTGERLQRALDRERSQKNPKYAELCRRFLADEEDFSTEKLKAVGIEKHYQNTGIEECVENILNDIYKPAEE